MRKQSNGDMLGFLILQYLAMSLPAYQIECTHCSYSERFAYDILYQSEGGWDAPVQPDLTHGWCEDCQKVLTIFTPFREETGKADIDKLNQLIADESAKRGRRNFLFFKAKVDEELIAAWEEKREAIARGIEQLRGRHFPNRCLTCGSERVTPVDLPSDYDVVPPLGITHHCGGQLVATMTMRLSFANRPRVVVDVFGNITLDERR